MNFGITNNQEFKISTSLEKKCMHTFLKKKGENQMIKKNQNWIPGYEQSVKGFRIQISETNKIEVSRDVVFSGTAESVNKTSIKEDCGIFLNLPKEPPETDSDAENEVKTENGSGEDADVDSEDRKKGTSIIRGKKKFTC